VCTSFPGVSPYRDKKVVGVFGVFDEKLRHLSGGILEAFGKLFFRDMKVFLYPMLDENGDITTSEFKVHPRMKSYTNSLSSTVK
jgi:hypothetical protein